jgi:hypothetical protein
MLDVQKPPAIYGDCKPSYAVGIPVPYNGVNVICRMLGFKTESHNINGCSIWSEGAFLMFLPKVERNVTRQDQESVRKHELAHACGWPADHPRY